MAIYKCDEGFVISSHRVWIDGYYADKRAANYAFRFSPDDLAKLNKDINISKDRAITYEDLLKLKDNKNGNL